MATVKDITTMCKDGKILEAYELAKENLIAEPDNEWAHKSIGWALYYLIKADVEVGNYSKFLNHFDELRSLSTLNAQADTMVLENVQFKVAEFVKNHLDDSDEASHDKLSAIFARLRSYTFEPSKGHSFLLQCVIKFGAWAEMADFIDWWGLDNLTDDDFTPFTLSDGKKMMTLAERAYIAQAKALLRQPDAARISAFLPKIDALMTQHDEMTYPGYFYGKLLMALGGDADAALRAIIPFARKKSSEFWVWQLLADVFAADDEKQMACLLRAVHCRTQEAFLGKVRTKLAELYVSRGLYAQARFQAEVVARSYATNGWRAPGAVAGWFSEPWFRDAVPDDVAPIDYMTITDQILCEGAEKRIAVVTYYDPKLKKASLVYGQEQRLFQRLIIDVQIGDILRIYYVTDKEGRIKIIHAEKAKLPDGLTYARHLDGYVVRREGQEFAFLKAKKMFVFVPPALVSSLNLKNGDRIKGIVVTDYNKKKETWDWVCVGVCNVFATAEAAA